jgi:hypothetical protein
MPTIAPKDAKTTDLDKIKEAPSTFAWGRVRRIHEIGQIAIVQYQDNDVDKATRYHLYVDGRDQSSSATTLYGALIAGIAEVQNDPSAARFACRVLGIES